MGLSVEYVRESVPTFFASPSSIGARLSLSSNQRQDSKCCRNCVSPDHVKLIRLATAQAFGLWFLIPLCISVNTGFHLHLEWSLLSNLGHISLTPWILDARRSIPFCITLSLWSCFLSSAASRPLGNDVTGFCGIGLRFPMVGGQLRSLSTDLYLKNSLLWRTESAAVIFSVERLRGVQ